MPVRTIAITYGPGLSVIRVATRGPTPGVVGGPLFGPEMIDFTIAVRPVPLDPALPGAGRPLLLRTRRPPWRFGGRCALQEPGIQPV